MELHTIESISSLDDVEFLSSVEFSNLTRAYELVYSTLDIDRQELSLRVAKRCVSIAKIMELETSDIIRLEIAAKVHRIGELYLDESLRKKSFLQMSGMELNAYRIYPIFSALRFSDSVCSEFHEILLNHREYYTGGGFPGANSGDDIPLTSRILCVATEYEELISFHGGDAIRDDKLQRRMFKNLIGRYDPKVLNGLMLSVSGENQQH